MSVEPEILLSNGGYYHFLDADAEHITIEVIAHALSNLCRFTGHTKRFYSVAEHSVRASYIGPDDEALERLMHDAAEALTGDVATPLKHQLLDYEPIETRAEHLLAEKFGYRYPYPPSVKIADRIMLATEKRDLMAADGRDWKMLEMVEPLDEVIPSDIHREGCYWQPYYWERMFLGRYREVSTLKIHDPVARLRERAAQIAERAPYSGRDAAAQQIRELTL
jgi:hypothetical protein